MSTGNVRRAQPGYLLLPIGGTVSVLEIRRLLIISANTSILGGTIRKILRTERLSLSIPTCRSRLLRLRLLRPQPHHRTILSEDEAEGNNEATATSSRVRIL